MRVTSLLLLTLTAAGAASAQEHRHAGHDSPASGVPLYANLGSLHREIATDVPLAGRYFDQGLRLQYAFNHAEAIRSYREALRHDPACAMCWWGIALALGPNINASMSPEAAEDARQAIGQARGLVRDDRERTLVEALAERYADSDPAARAKLDSAYARAMGEVAERYPDDPDALTLHAAALMNLSPWNYWTGDYGSREPRQDTPRILSRLQSALDLKRDHPGACHYYIHAVEAAHPQRAVECADRLAALMPGAGHIVHMPGHIYIRVGRYADAVTANEHAVHADESYISDQRPGGLYPAAYYPHNYHFMAFAATMAGMGDKALWAARQVAPKVPLDVAREVYWVQNIVVFTQLTQVTLGRWNELLAEPMPPSDLPVATVMAHYARGTAFAATERRAEAEAALRHVERIAAEHADDEVLTLITGVARHALAGEVALRSGDAGRAVTHFEAAAKLEDEMLYEEPPLWYYPIRHSLGRALLEAGRPADAERAYRQDLRRFPENGWSLFGLAMALEAQGRDTDARQIRDRFEAAWQRADLTLTASRF